MTFDASFKIYQIELSEIYTKSGYNNEKIKKMKAEDCAADDIEFLVDELEVQKNCIDEINTVSLKLLSHSISVTANLTYKIKYLKLKNRKLKKKKVYLKKLIKDTGTNTEEQCFSCPLDNKTPIRDDGKAYDHCENSTDADILDNKLDFENTPNNLKILIGQDSKKREVKWSTNDIVEEVRSAANDVVQNSGYDFLDDLQIYYDRSSGYYYDPKTSLYYDSKSKSYFYYDHDSKSYQFYAYAETETEIQECVESCDSKAEVVKDVDSVDDEHCFNINNPTKCDSDRTVEISAPADLCLVNADYSSGPDIAPCLRLMVTSGDEKGSLHVVTLTGGTIGRDSSNLVVLSDPSVSKVHAKVSYSAEGPFDHHYFLKDLGSNNGTFVRNVRLSDSRSFSDPVELGHGWTFQAGNVHITCHIHPGYLTCNSCEPGLLPHKEMKKSMEENTENKERTRLRVNRRLKKKYKLQERGPKPIGYKDRANKRRNTVGSDNPYEKTEVASVDVCISESNKGFKLMEKMGWSQGQGLGLDRSGIIQPVLPLVPSFNHAGLGATSSRLISPDQLIQSNLKKEILNLEVDTSGPISSPTVDISNQSEEISVFLKEMSESMMVTSNQTLDTPDHTEEILVLKEKILCSMEEA